MKNIFLFIGILISLSINAQHIENTTRGPQPDGHDGTPQFGDLKIKERFDLVYRHLYDDPSKYIWNAQGLYSSNSSVSLAHQNVLGSSRSGSLIALLVMYEATCDQDYLLEFMSHATKIMNARADKVGYSTLPYWFKDQVPWHGRILLPLSKFVHIVYDRHATLYNQAIVNPHNFGGHNTIGKFADWVNQSNKEVMDYLLSRHWRANDECMCRPSKVWDYCTNSQSSTSKSISELNYQAPYGSALIYMYLANYNRLDYGVKAVEMARAYLTTRNGILSYNGTHNAYYWYHDGWQQQKKWWQNNSSWERKKEHKEDLGHGGWDIMFPILFNQHFDHFYPRITGGRYFEDYQMVRFKNMFSRLVFNYDEYPPLTYANKTTFSCTVDGSCYGYYNASNFPQSAMQSRAKLFTELYLYDNVSGSIGDDVYEIMMRYYTAEEDVAPIDDNNYGGLLIKGLADMVAANYKKAGINSGCSANRATAAIQETKESLTASIFPNPAKHNISIQTNKQKSSSIQVSIHHLLTGKLALSTQQVQNINIANLPAGIYLVKIIQDKETVHKQLIIE
ncbi:T9SS type A sorting domain-containing protein [Aquimarina rhabdastrellae]